jgi:hypothetical protein
MGFRKGENRGNKFAVGHRASTRPDFCTQTLISQLNEIDKRTGKEKVHMLCDTLYKLATGYTYKRKYKEDGKRKVEEVEVQPDVLAIREIIDRLQGKAPQAVKVGGDPDNPLEVINVIERVIIDANEDSVDRDAANLPTAH